MVRYSLLCVVASASMGLSLSADPCALATASRWVSSELAHACELTAPFNRMRSLAVVDSAIKSLPYYSLETWFQHSPNPHIPHDINVRSLLQDIQTKTATSGYNTDWDFNIAVTDAYNREQDGHSLYVAACTQSFSWNLPFSIGMLADTPFHRDPHPVFLVNYDFPNQNRPGFETHFEHHLGVHVRPYDGARILSIEAVGATQYLTELATQSSIYDGLAGGFESADARFVRLVSRYSADSTPGLYTQELGGFAQRSFYPGKQNVTVRLQTAQGVESLTIPWAATFAGKGNTTASFIAKNCELPAAESTESVVQRSENPREGMRERRKAVVAPDAQLVIRATASATEQDTHAANYVRPNLTSFGHFITLDIYQLEKHPKIGVVYFEQFEPSRRYDYRTYFDGISDTLYTGLTALKKAGVEHILIDISGNRGGYINVGAIALWSLWPQDLYPGFPAVFRANDLIQREAGIAAAANDSNSEYFYGNYKSPHYKSLTSNKQFMDPSVPQTVNGVQDAYSHPFFDDFGNGSAAVTRFTKPPFKGTDYILVSNGICASTCSIFSSYLWQKHGVRSAVFGGMPNANGRGAQFDAGVKGAEVTSLDSILFELENAGLKNDKAAPQPFPIRASLSLNFRNAIPYIDKQDGILEYVWEQGTKTYQFTHELYNNPQRVWEFVAEEFFVGK